MKKYREGYLPREALLREFKKVTDEIYSHLPTALDMRIHVGASEIANMEVRYEYYIETGEEDD